MSGIGDYIRNQRNALDITQEDLANRLAERGHKFAKSTIGWWEKGRSIPPIHESSFLFMCASHHQSKTPVAHAGVFDICSSRT